MSSISVKNFMKQQGFTEEPDSVCDGHFSGLSFQPKVLGMMVVIGLLLQSPMYFLVLSAVLWWNVAFKRWNLFELLYNRVVARPGGKELLGPAPPPRLFAQGMAATFFLLTGLALLSGWVLAAWIFEALVVIAIAALLFGKFCMGSYIYHLSHGKISFANATLPWVRSER